MVRSPWQIVVDPLPINRSFIVRIGKQGHIYQSEEFWVEEQDERTGRENHIHSRNIAVRGNFLHENPGFVKNMVPNHLESSGYLPVGQVT